MEVNDVTSWCVGMVVILKLFEFVQTENQCYERPTLFPQLMKC